MRLPLLLALALSALAATGCSRPFVPATPPTFVELSDQEPGYDYRATTADGLVLAARAIDNDPEGDLAFWEQAIKNKIRDLGGYALLEARPVECRGGLKGTQLRFGHDEASEAHLYYVTIFLTKKRIFLLEAGGTKAQFARFAGPIDWSVRNFQPK